VDLIGLERHIDNPLRCDLCLLQKKLASGLLVVVSLILVVCCYSLLGDHRPGDLNLDDAHVLEALVDAVDQKQALLDIAFVRLGLL
jgi:hypothetical protein